MTNDDDDSMKLPYPVGKGRPPVEHRFQKGRSGNPKGRPPKKKSPDEAGYRDPHTGVILRETARKVALREGDATVYLTVFEATVRRLGVKAMTGDHRAIKELMQHHRSAVCDQENEGLQERLAVFEYKKEWEPRFAKARRENRPPPEKFPHPAHVNICSVSGRLKITGPMDKATSEAWEALKEVLRTNDYFIDLEESSVDPDQQSALRLKHLKRAKLKFSKMVPAGWDRYESI
jgi:hypothetical protein